MSNNSRAMSAIPHQELPILEQLITLRNRLTALKRDGSEFIRPSDVQEIYKGVLKQIAKLNSVRDERNGVNEVSSSASASAGQKINRVHTPASHPDTCQFLSNKDIQGLDGSSSSNSHNNNDGSNNSRPTSSSGPSSSSSSNHQNQSSSSSTNTNNNNNNNNNNPEADISAALNSTNRVDTTLNDVFALLSLFFLTIGRGKESPATFSQLGCMKQLLDHLAEAGVYTEIDLLPFEKRLKELREIIRKDSESGKSPSQLNKFMMRQLEGCEKVLSSLQGTLSVLSAELVPIHQQLVAIRRQIAVAAAKPKPAKSEIKQLQEELRKIDSKRVDGKFLGPGGSSVPAGQAILVGLLEESFEICHDVVVKNRNDEIPGTLQVIFERLSSIKSQLENLVLTHRWTLRETDLWNYQISLKEIDKLRVNGKFLDSDGKVPEGQLVLLYLLRRCYGLVYRLVASSEPISEELLPISNKLSTVSKCLREISKFSGPFTMRDLYPYKLALHQIDGMRTLVKTKDKEGKEIEVFKWLGRDGSIPEGQAILKAQYEEVEQTIEEMLNREEDDDDDDDDDEDLEGNWDDDERDESTTNSLNSVSDDDADTMSASASNVSEDEIGLRSNSRIGIGNGNGLGNDNINRGNNANMWNRWRNESTGISVGIPPGSSNFNFSSGGNGNSNSNNNSYPASPNEASSFNPSYSPFQTQQQQGSNLLNPPENKRTNSIPNNINLQSQQSSIPQSQSQPQQPLPFNLEKVSLNDSSSNQEVQTPIASTSQNQNQNERISKLKASELDSSQPSRSDSPTPKPPTSTSTLQQQQQQQQSNILLPGSGSGSGSGPGTSSISNFNSNSNSNPTAPFGAVEPLSSQLSENHLSLSRDSIGNQQPLLMNLSENKDNGYTSQDGVSSDSDPRSI